MSFTSENEGKRQGGLGLAERRSFSFFPTKQRQRQQHHQQQSHSNPCSPRVSALRNPFSSSFSQPSSPVGFAIGAHRRSLSGGFGAAEPLSPSGREVKAADVAKLLPVAAHAIRVTVNPTVSPRSFKLSETDGNRFLQQLSVAVTSAKKSTSSSTSMPFGLASHLLAIEADDYDYSPVSVLLTRAGGGRIEIGKGGQRFLLDAVADSLIACLDEKAEGVFARSVAQRRAAASRAAELAAPARIPTHQTQPQHMDLVMEPASPSASASRYLRRQSSLMSSHVKKSTTRHKSPTAAKQNQQQGSLSSLLLQQKQQQECQGRQASSSAVAPTA